MISPTTAADLAEEVARIYRDAELRLLARIASSLAEGINLDEWAVQQLARVQRIRPSIIAELRAVNAEAAAAIQLALERAYFAGELSALADVRGLVPGELTDPRPAVLAIANDIATGLQSATTAILRGVDDTYRSIVAQATASVLAGAEGRRAATQRAINAMLGDGLTFTDVRGRRWSTETYAEMAVRTGVARGAIQGHVDQMAGMGQDLVIIRPGPRSCRICDQWARVVLSISGTTGTRVVERVNGPGTITVEVIATLDEARAAGWGHPNCRCGIRSYMPGITDLDMLDRPAWDAEGYEAQQRQRAIERKVREWKTREAIAIEPRDAAAARQRVKGWQAEQRRHLADNPSLKRRSEREQIGGRFSGKVPNRPAPRPSARPKPQGRDYRGMTDSERVEAARIMFGTDSPEYREARRRWG